MSSPLVFDLAWKHDKHARSGVHRNSLVLFDSAGESISSRGRIGELEQLKEADGIIFAVDSWPLARFAGVEITPQQTGGDEWRPAQVLAAIAQVLHPVSSTGGLIDIPVAITLMKADLLRGTGSFPDEKDFFNRERHLGWIDRSRPWMRNTDISSTVAKVDEGELRRVVDTNFSTYEFFAVSALGDSPTSDFKAKLPIKPLRVTDPLMWLLAEVRP
jgi:hypothetical protein